MNHEFGALRVLATRPEQQNLAWHKRLEHEGYQAVSAPMLAIEALTESQQTKNVILDLDQMQRAIFVSQNAVRYGFDWIESYWPQIPAGITWYAIGAKTQKVLQARLRYCDTAAAAINIETSASMNSEALLALPSLQEVNDEKIALFRGQGGRTLLASSLEARGAKIFHTELYCRKCPSEAKAALTALRLGAEDIVPLFSGESLQNYHALFNTLTLDCGQPNIILPGERVAELARELGFNQFTVAENASEEAMLAAIRKMAFSTAKSV